MTTATTPRERPILFGDPMVRAILAGTKTQTRRVMKRHPPFQDKDGVWVWRPDRGQTTFQAASGEPRFDVPSGWAASWCPFGMPGHRLWVRETHRIDFDSGSGRLMADGRYRREADYRVVYRARGNDLPIRWEGYDHNEDPYVRFLGRDESWRPSIFMPRWASRITLEIEDVRVERLQAISEADARAEGIRSDILPACGDHPDLQCYVSVPDDNHAYRTAAEAFRKTWDSINGAGAWDRNEFVWAISFRRLAEKGGTDGGRADE